MSEFLIQTYRIINATNWLELKSLTQPDEDAYGLIISAGLIDLADGSIAQTKLYELFPIGTITGDNIRSISSGLVKPPDAPIEEE